MIKLFPLKVFTTPITWGITKTNNLTMIETSLIWMDEQNLKKEKKAEVNNISVYCQGQRLAVNFNYSLFLWYS